MQSEEYSLIKQCIEGNTEKYAILVERHKNMLYNVAFRMLGDVEAAHDITQESFISAYRALQDFKKKSKFSTWLYTITINKCKDYLKSKKPHIPIDDISEMVTSTKENPEEELNKKQLLKGLQKALNALPEDYREVIVLKHIEGLDYREMEAILGVNINALKVRTHRGREMLKRLLKETGVVNG